MYVRYQIGNLANVTKLLLQLPLIQVDEMESLVTGLNFVLRKELIKDEVFTVTPENEMISGCLDEVCHSFIVIRLVLLLGRHYYFHYVNSGMTFFRFHIRSCWRTWELESQ